MHQNWPLGAVSGAVACRGCWMPGANEGLGCPRIYFLFVPQNFSRPFFSCQISGQFALWMPPFRAASCSGNDIFLFIFCHLPIFILQKLAPWMPPRVDARGRRTVRTPLCTPLLRRGKG